MREFGYAWDEVHDEAEVLEHAISDRLLEGIDERLGRPRYDPHGDAIPDAAGDVHREPFVLLAAAARGSLRTRAARERPRPRAAARGRGRGRRGRRRRSRWRMPRPSRIAGADVALPAAAAEAVWLSA